LLLIINYISGG